MSGLPDVPWWGALLAMILPAPVIIRLVRFADGWTKRRSELEKHNAEAQKATAEAQEETAQKREREITARQRIEKQERDRDTPHLVQQLNQEREERRSISVERNRLATENIALIEEISAKSFENISLKDRIDLLEKDMNVLRQDVRDCHGQRDLDRRQRDLDVAWSRALLRWVMKEFVPRDPVRLSEPPKRRDILDSTRPEDLDDGAFEE